MTDFTEPTTISGFEDVKDQFGQAMFGSNWLSFSQNRDQLGTLPPWMLDKDAMTCPVGHTCVPEAGTNGMFVRSLHDNDLYLSEHGLQRFLEGEDTDWAGVARDLLRILGGSLGGVAPGIVGLIAQALGISEYAVDCWFNNNC